MGKLSAEHIERAAEAAMTAIVDAGDAESALAIVMSHPRSVVDALADLCHAEYEGRRKEVVAREIVTLSR